MGEHIKCKKCGIYTDVNMEVCSKCGTPLAIKSCPECGKKIDAVHVFCPYCGYMFKHIPAPQNCNSATKRGGMGQLLFFPIIAAIIAIGIGVYTVLTPPASVPEESTKPTPETSQTDIPRPPRAGVPYKFAQHFVREHLVSPKTAEFLPLNQAHCVRLSDGKTWRITSFVDSQNRFGAMVRTKFTVTITEVDAFTRMHGRALFFR